MLLLIYINNIEIVLTENCIQSLLLIVIWSFILTHVVLKIFDYSFSKIMKNSNQTMNQNPKPTSN